MRAARLAAGRGTTVARCGAPGGAGPCTQHVAAAGRAARIDKGHSE